MPHGNFIWGLKLVAELNNKDINQLCLIQALRILLALDQLFFLVFLCIFFFFFVDKATLQHNYKFINTLINRGM